MHDRELEGVPSAELRDGLQASLLSIAWTLCASSVTVTVGIAANSLVLLAFGLTGLLDAAGSVSLVVHFRHALHHEAISAGHERFALRLVTFGLVVVGLSTAGDSAWRLAEQTRSRPAPAGLVVAAISIVVLGVLSERKRRVAGRIPSRALLADARLSATGALLAAVTVAGTALESAYGWWWVDPIAAAAVAIAAVVVGVAMARNHI